ncbi:hypothetical protein DFP73DRAFT_303781 [Morchella snyderi]|nr:hypothetical protein DFP73DRAFT_303781 [Morchella snyderi]
MYGFDSALNQREKKGLLKRISSSSTHSSSSFMYSDLAPNLSLNMGGQTVPVFELWVVVVFGMVLQLGVLLFVGFSDLLSHRSSSFKKDGAILLSYAFPLMAIGTCSLVLGMFLCSHVVDRIREVLQKKPGCSRN